MKRFVAALVLAATLALVLACGSGGVETQPADETDGRGSSQESQTTPTAVDADVEATAVVTPTAAATRSLAAGLREQMDELVLGEGDVPAGFHTLVSTDMDPFVDFLNRPMPQGTAAHMSMLLAPDSQETITSMVILMQDDTAVEEAFSHKDDLNIEAMEGAFNMMGDDQRLGQTLIDARELDVSALGEQAYGLRVTTDMGQAGIMDQEIVGFGKGSVVGMVMTAALGGTAAHAVPLAQTMAEKIEAALQ